MEELVLEVAAQQVARANMALQGKVNHCQPYSPKPDDDDNRETRSTQHFSPQDSGVSRIPILSQLSPKTPPSSATGYTKRSQAERALSNMSNITPSVSDGEEKSDSGEVYICEGNPSKKCSIVLKMVKKG